MIAMDSREFFRLMKERNSRIKRVAIVSTVILCLIWIPIALLWIY